MLAVATVDVCMEEVVHFHVLGIDIIQILI